MTQTTTPIPDYKTMEQSIAAIVARAYAGDASLGTTERDICDLVFEALEHPMIKHAQEMHELIMKLAQGEGHAGVMAARELLNKINS